jgi:uncharacterized repeat protein (TIGR01451 family)
MADYNPNSNWTSKKRENVPVSAPKTAPAPSINSSPAVKKENVEMSSRSKGGGHGLVWFFVACVAFVAGAVFFFFFLRPTPGPDVSISFVKPDQVFIGDQFVFSVSLANNSQVALKNALLEVILPDGFSFVGQSLDQRMMQQAIGDLALGSVTKQDFNLIATGNQNSVGHVTVKLVYGAGTASTNQFESDSAADIITGQSAVGLNFTIPQNVFAGQSFAMTVNYNNNTSHAISNVVLNLQYPPTFVMSTSSVAPANGGSWKLGTIAGNAGGSITITGTVSGQAGVAYPFTGALALNLSGVDYAVNTVTANAVLAASPLSLSIALNNTSTYIANAGDQLNYVLSYANNSNVAFQNIVIQAALAGDMYDFSSLKSDGSFSSITNTVTWSPATSQELTSLVPGQSGSVKIALVAKKSFPIKSANDKNYVLKMHAQIQSPTVPPNTSASSTIGTADLTNDVRGEIVIAAMGYRNDPSSGIVNTGPYPPTVNQPSQYTIHWDVTNYSTDVQNVTVSAYLQSGSVFTGQEKSNTNTQPTYDAATGLVTWNIGNLSAGTGVLGAPAEAVFQITNTPAVNQVGQVVPLMTQTNLSADDTFTNSMLQASAAPITTYLSTGNSGQVVQ